MVEEITSGTGSAMAKALNTSSPLTVYGMARRAMMMNSSSSSSSTTTTKLTNVKVKMVTNQGCEISYVSCRGDLCEMNTCFYTFPKPLQSAQELFDTEQLQILYNDVCSPRSNEILSSPIYLLVLLISIFLGYSTMILGQTGFEDVIVLNMPVVVQNIITTLFGSTIIFYHLIRGSWYFLISAHLGESIFAAYYCIYGMKFTTSTTMKWFLWGLSGGYLTLYQLVEFVKLQLEEDKTLQQQKLE